jgi:hypothetical protein
MEQLDTVDLLLSALSDILIKSTEIRNSYMEDDSVVAEIEDVGNLYYKFKEFRNGIDRLEGLLNQAIRIKAKADNLYAESCYNIEDAEVELVGKKTNDYQSSRDRNIEINAATITQRRASRKVEKLRTEARATVQVVGNHHRGLEGSRRDLEVRLRALSFISPLEK